VADMLRTGAAWLTDQLRESAAVPCTYVRGNTSTQITACIGRSMFEAATQSGVVEQWESRDYIVKVGTLPYSEPERGDKIVETYGDVSTTYSVSSPRGVPLWHYADAFRTSVKIHTVAESESAVIPGTLLARAVGTFAGTTITDGQVIASLAVDQSTGRALSRTLAPASAYVYVVLPTSFGAPTLKVNGIVSTAWETTQRSITFAGQAARSYTLYRSTYAVTGTLNLEVA